MHFKKQSNFKSGVKLIFIQRWDICATWDDIESICSDFLKQRGKRGFHNGKLESPTKFELHWKKN